MLRKIRSGLWIAFKKILNSFENFLTSFNSYKKLNVKFNSRFILASTTKCKKKMQLEYNYHMYLKPSLLVPALKFLVTMALFTFITKNRGGHKGVFSAMAYTLLCHCIFFFISKFLFLNYGESPLN